jgi:hypothetical protein
MDRWEREASEKLKEAKIVEMRRRDQKERLLCQACLTGNYSCTTTYSVVVSLLARVGLLEWADACVVKRAGVVGLYRMSGVSFTCSPTGATSM